MVLLWAGSHQRKDLHDLQVVLIVLLAACSEFHVLARFHAFVLLQASFVYPPQGRFQLGSYFSSRVEVISCLFATPQLLDYDLKV